MREPLLIRVGVTLVFVGGCAYFALFLLTLATPFQPSFLYWGVPSFALVALGAMCTFAQIVREMWTGRW